MIDLMKLRFMAGRSLKSQGMYVFSGELVLPPLQFAAPQSAALQRAFPGSLSGGGYRKQASRGSECSSGSETDSTNTVTARQPLNIDIIAGARPGSHHDRFLSHPSGDGGCRFRSICQINLRLSKNYATVGAEIPGKDGLFDS